MLTVIKLTTNIPERHQCSKLTINIPERRQWRRSGIFIVNSEHISHLVLVFLLLTGKCRLGWNEVWSVNEI